MKGDVSVDSEAIYGDLVKSQDSLNQNQSLEGVYRGRVYVYTFIGLSVYT
nr:hypothetical protein [uncultured organism]